MAGQEPGPGRNQGWAGRHGPQTGCGRLICRRSCSAGTTERFTAAHTRHCGDMPCSLESMPDDEFEERSQLVRRPEPEFYCGECSCPRRLGARGRIRCQEASIEGVGERFVHDRVDVMDGLGAQATRSIASPARQEFGVERVQLVRPYISDIATAQVWEHVVIHVAPVRLEGARLHLGAHGWKPLLLDPLLQGQLYGFGVGALVKVADNLGACNLGFLSGAETAVPLLASLAIGVTPEVDDDVQETAEATELYGEADPAHFPEVHRFQVPEGCHWRDVRETPSNVGTALQHAMQEIERANPETLYRVFGTADWGNKEKFTDALLKDMIEGFSSIALGNHDVDTDILGDAYEYLVGKFADVNRRNKAGEFYTPRSVVRMMVDILDPQEGESIYDPACGTGGMLLAAIDHVKEAGGDPRTFYGKIYGQEKNLTTSSVARMNLVLHGRSRRSCEGLPCRSRSLSQGTATNGVVRTTDRPVA